jgi:hypothetical protein
MRANRIYHPEFFQGRSRKKKYFEGWYFKMALPATEGQEEEVLAVIPGISLGEQGSDRHAFIQVISKQDGCSHDIRFPYESFSAGKRKPEFRIGKNLFSKERIELHIESDDLVLHGKVTHHGLHPFPVTFTAPGIMGWYGYAPFMECFHGVISTGHDLSGSLFLNGRKTDCTGGSGYIEKDWGTSFPSAWIWMQSNSFPSQIVSCMLSVAKIPFLGRVFTGFLGFVRIGDTLLRFGTYTDAKITRLETDGDHAYVRIETGRNAIEFTATLGPASRLVAPRQGTMDRTITESICGALRLRVLDRDGDEVFDETGIRSGIELSEARALWK